MFTGIVEGLGKVASLMSVDENLHIKVACDFLSELKVDQSIAHNGVCLTVTELDKRYYEVVAVKETLMKTNLKHLKVGDMINLERCLKVGDRLDGHFVQGHVDCKAVCTSAEDHSGSWMFTFSFPEEYASLVVSKGSITINGVSLTVISPTLSSFSVTIIPYTYDHTTFKSLHIGDEVNLEFDILGKYIMKKLSLSEQVQQ